MLEALDGVLDEEVSGRSRPYLYKFCSYWTSIVFRVFTPIFNKDCWNRQVWGHSM